MVAAGQAAYDPPGQAQAALLYWRTPDEWAQVLHEWVGPPSPPRPLSFILALVPLFPCSFVPFPIVLLLLASETR